MAVQYPKWKSYTMGSYEVPHIYREPPKSVYTRKKERVNIADVEYMIRNDDSRINEGVSYISRGSNPHVDVSYSNYGGNGATLMSLPSVMASNPYKVMKDGAFRPPIFTQEDILPLSRMRHPETSAITNPGLPNGYNNPNLPSLYDDAPVKMSIDKMKINYLPVEPTASINLDGPHEINVQNAIRDDILLSSVPSNPSYQEFDNDRNTNTNIGIIDRPLIPVLSPVNINITNTERNENIDIENYIKNNPQLKNISSNVGIVIYDPNNKNYTEVQGSIKDKLNITVQSSLNNPIDLIKENGTHIKLKDYLWKVVRTNAGRDIVVIQPSADSEIQLERNMPLYSASSNVFGYTKDAIYDTNVITKESQNTTVTAPMTLGYGRQETIHDYPNNINLRRMANFGSFENSSSMPVIEEHPIPYIPKLR